MENLMNWLHDLPKPVVFLLLLVISAIGAALLMLIVKLINKVEDYFSRKRELKQYEIDKQAYQAYINQLPLLRNNHLLMVEGEVSLDSARTFGSRYDGMVIYDEFGQMWVGLRTPEIMEDLVAGEFLQEDYWVPFCGPGEAEAGKPVEIGDMQFLIYPTLLRGLPVQDRRWQTWAEIQKNYEENGSLRRQTLKYREALSYDKRRDLEMSRRRFGYVQPEFFSA
jgi:hypothetical protein